MTNGLLGILALATAGLCFWVPRTDWMRNRLVGEEENEEKVRYYRRQVKVFTYIGIAWVILGLLQFGGQG